LFGAKSHGPLPQIAKVTPEINQPNNEAIPYNAVIIALIIYDVKGKLCSFALGKW